MITALFIIAFFLYFSWAIKIDYWITIKLLGFGLECPQAFFTNESPYIWMLRILFLISIILGYFSAISLYVVIPIFIMAWFISGVVGHKRAYLKYRSELIDMADQETNPTKKAEYLALSKKTDEQLNDDALNSAKRERELAKYR